MSRAIAAALVLLIGAATADAQPAEQRCIRMEPVPGFEGWGKPRGAMIAVGRMAVLALHPARSVRFVPALARTPTDDSSGGVFTLSIPRGGRYAIALSAKAWIDVVRHGRRQDSRAHRHGPACSGIAKIVEYDLPAGRYSVQLSEAADPTIGIMVSGGRAGGIPGA